MTSVGKREWYVRKRKRKISGNCRFTPITLPTQLQKRSGMTVMRAHTSLCTAAPKVVMRTGEGYGMGHSSIHSSSSAARLDLRSTGTLLVV